MNGGIAIGDPCRVCDEPVTEHSNACCNRCAGAFHLALRQDVPARDCGQVWINDESMALEFACNLCLIAEGVIPAPRPEPAAGRKRYARRDTTRAVDVVRARRTDRR